MRDEIYVLISKAHKHDWKSKIYNYFICTVSVVSIVPLMFKQTNAILEMLDLITVYLLFLDYILRWIVADYTVGKKKGIWSFIMYPFTPFAILDIISLLPSLGLLSKGWRMLRMLRISKILHYSKNFALITKVFNKEKETLSSVLVIAISYIFVSALAMFSYEPNTFDSFFDALYWATTALTTVGYGDVYPVSQVGKFISMISSIFGIAVIALPAGIITGGFLEQISNRDKGDN